jgi:nucleoside 2-deoxyribosyltransferase
MRAYIAGPLFNQGERWFDEQIEGCAAELGLETFLPHRDTMELLPIERSMDAIFKTDIRGLDESAIVIANLNGITTDPGTAWELGYAYAKGKHLIGVLTDMRLTVNRTEQGLMFENQVGNVMVQCSLHKLVFSLEELGTYLQAYLQAETETPHANRQPGAAE